MKKILIIEDDEKIGRFLELELKHETYDVTLKQDGRAGYETALKGDYDLIILDLMLPYLSGIEVCRRLRKDKKEVPIIMLTAKDDVSDKVMGLDIGADDYMTKPFFIEELLARIRVGLKKNHKVQRKEDNNSLQHQGLKVDKDRHEVTYNDEIIILTKKEFDLLKYLLENKNIVLTREKIIEEVWGYDYIGESNIVGVYISYIRNKIDQKYDINLIETIRGVGYVIRETE